MSQTVFYETGLGYTVLHIFTQVLFFAENHGNDRDISGGLAVWAIAHPVFGRIEGAAGRRRGGSGGVPQYYVPTQF